MTIEEYLQELDDLIDTAPEVVNVDITRLSVWDTGMEIVALYRYKLTLSDRSVLELTERLIEMRGTFTITKYRHHWQDRNAQIIKRWDNAPHHRDIKTFPHHVHAGTETHVLEHNAVIGLDALKIVIDELTGT
jgi:hypothetical protein